MKKLYLIWALAATSYGVSYAQATSYPASAGDNGGNTNSYFGHEAGLVNTGTNNTFIGYRSGFSNTTGIQNTATGYQALYSNTTGVYNTANGYQALYSNTTGWYNTATGYSALYSNTTGWYNTATGFLALLSNTTGGYNTATGYSALYNNTTGAQNTATGYQALYTNMIGNYNTANGHQALSSNFTAGRNTAMGTNALYTQSFSNGGVAWNSDNVALGFEALYSNQPTANTNGYRNTAIGTQALRSNTTGAQNTATGYQALYSNTTGTQNTATGYYVLYFNTTGNYNIATGNYALFGNTTGNYNIATGYYALYSNTTGNYNTATGQSALQNNTTGSYNTALGSGAGPNAGNYSNTTALGNGASVNANNKIRLGNAAVTVIEGQVGFSFPSDGRFKDNIREEDVKGLEFINRLRPVVYNFDTKKFTEFLTQNLPDSIRSRHLEQDFAPSTAIRQSGFIAQEVEKAAAAVSYNFNGIHKPDNENDNYSLAYSQFVVPLVKAVQELSGKEKAQQQRIEALERELETLKTAVYGDSKTPNSSSKTTGEVAQTLPQGFALYQNTPNPFDKTTAIAATLPEGVQQASILVYNLQGLELANYPLTRRGNVSVEISGGHLPEGMYLYALVADGRVIDTKKMILTK